MMLLNHDPKVVNWQEQVYFFPILYSWVSPSPEAFIHGRQVVSANATLFGVKAIDCLQLL